jgi:hypothetical protein
LEIKMSLLLGPRLSSATGGSIANVGGFTIHTFSSSGTFIPKGNGYVEVLVIGGGGGSNGGGGGGGGSTLYQKFIPVLSGVAYTMTVGSGAVSLTPGGITTCTYNGGSIIAPGGGSGGSAGAPPSISANNPLGSSGGSWVTNTVGLSANVINYGFTGGGGVNPFGGGGGGGGSGGSGVTYVPPSTGGAGGIGVSYSITGTSVYYGGGDGGAPNGVTNPAPSFSNFGYGQGPSSSSNPGAIIIRYQT